MQKTNFMGAMSIPAPESRLTEIIICEYHTDPFFHELHRLPKEPFEVGNGLLLRGSRLFIPDGLTRIKLLHDYYYIPCTGHLRETKTLNRLLPLYCWQNIKKSVENYVKSCRVCEQLMHATISHADCFNQ